MPSDLEHSRRTLLDAARVEVSSAATPSAAVWHPWPLRCVILCRVRLRAMSAHGVRLRLMGFSSLPVQEDQRPVATFHPCLCCCHRHLECIGATAAHSTQHTAHTFPVPSLRVWQMGLQRRHSPQTAIALVGGVVYVSYVQQRGCFFRSKISASLVSRAHQHNRRGVL